MKGARRLTRRQRRLLAWLHDPARERVAAGERAALPTGAAIDWTQAIWTTRDVIELSGVYSAKASRQCRTDLFALRAMGYLDPDVFWRVGSVSQGASARVRSRSSA